MVNSPPYLVADQLSYELGAERTLFQDVSLSLATGDRVALVGANGVGKSTLLKILANQLVPSTGTVARHASLYYLPQVSTVPPALKTQTVVEFLSQQSDDWWDIPAILQAVLQTSLDLAVPMGSLSGGELTKLLLAVGLHQAPAVLLLDEPTNHLDYLALERLRQYLSHFAGAFVLVSHKPFFLDQVVNTTWELSPTGLTVYGGNFSHYRDQKQAMLEAQLRDHSAAQQALKRAKATAVQEQKRAARSSRVGRQKLLKGSISPMAAGILQRQAQVSAGKAKQNQAAAIDAATQRVADTKVPTNKAVLIQLDPQCSKRRTLMDITGAELWVADRRLAHDVCFLLRGGDRISLAGANGSGKSSLAKALLGQSEGARLQGGSVNLAAGLKSMYLDQTYGVVRRDRTLLQNMQAVNPALSHQLHRQQLGHFLFRQDDVNKSAAVLSGGELARLAIAMLTLSGLDLLILDEPTNNLDVSTVDHLVEAINAYSGALWVISHDLDFLSRIGITQSLALRNQTLQPTQYLPNEIELYYRELLDSDIAT